MAWERDAGGNIIRDAGGNLVFDAGGPPCSIALCRYSQSPYGFYSFDESESPISIPVRLTNTGSPPTITTETLHTRLYTKYDYSEAEIEKVDEDLGVVWQFSPDGVGDWDIDIQFNTLSAESFPDVYIRAIVDNDGSVTTDLVGTKIRVSGSRIGV